MTDVRIPVPGGIVGHGKTYDAVVIVEPTLQQYLEIGEPVVWIFYPDGSRTPTTNPTAIERYITLCVKEPPDPLLLNQGGIKLARKMREAILGFFHDEVDGGTAPSPTSQTTSSGNAETDALAPGTLNA